MSHRTPEQLLERGWKTKSGESVQCVALAEELAELDQQHAYVCDWTPQRLVTWLEQRGFPELAVCGGASVYQQFLQAGVVETLYLTVEPIVFGSGVSFTMGLSAPLRWQLISKRALNENTLLLEYQRAD
jgi:riboflavin biosynthesis pyrimidine reductase